MQWSDDGLVLGIRKHGETSAVVELMTREHGRHFGLVHGGRSKAMQPVLQAGNLVRAVWRARLDEHLGAYQIEPLRAADLMHSSLALYGLGAVAAHLRLLPERDPHPGLYETVILLIEHLADEDIAAQLFARFEVRLLTELGFGLDLTACAATGTTEDLVYVSPKTGRAVAAGPAEPYKHRLLPLPAFLAKGGSLDHESNAEALAQAFALTEHFLRVHVLGPRGLDLPAERLRFVARCLEGQRIGG